MSISYAFCGSEADIVECKGIGSDKDVGKTGRFAHNRDSLRIGDGLMMPLSQLARAFAFSDANSEIGMVGFFGCFTLVAAAKFGR
jgi:hypothetical protein